MVDTKTHTAPDPVDPGSRDAVHFTRSEIRTRSPMSFGHYELVARLRVGGMAEVFRARDLDQPGREVAIKRILPSFTDEADYVAMFDDEARLSLRLRHPHIVQAYELGQVEDEHFIALELVEGQDAAALIRLARERSEPVPVAVACHVAIAVCEALHYAHELRDERGAPLGVVHRDVSPQNILISYDGDVKLIDFGIAKSTEQVMRTQAGLLKGKHGYLSPEQALGHDVDRRSDVWSLGVCLYELLAARRLFQGSSDFSTIVRVRKGEIPPLRGLNAAVPDELAAIVHRALERDKAARYQSADAMREALLRFVEGGDERCDRARLAGYMRARFGGGGDAANEAEAAARPADGATGLLDAFDGLEPPSALSQLSELPPASLEAVPEEDGAPTEPPLALEPSEDEADLLEEVESYEGLGEPEGDELQGDEPSTDEAPVRAPAAAVAAPPDRGGFDEDDDADDDLEPNEPTRVVAYESTQSGELSSQAAAAGVEPSPAAPEAPEDETIAMPVPAAGAAPSAPAAAAAATLPGLGMEWDDEELSTQIYDPPSYSEEAAGIGSAARADATPGRASRVDGAPVPSLRPGAGSAPAAMPLPFASTPSIAPPLTSTPGRLSLPPPGALPVLRASVPPPGGGAPSPFAALPPQGSVSMPPMGGTYRAPTAAMRPSAAETYAAQGPSRRALLLATLAAVAIVAAVFGGLALFGKPAKGTIHVATDPPDARVTLDGVPAPGSTSPFILTDVAPDVTHEIEVQSPGYRTWRTRLTVRPGKVEELPRVQLMREAPDVAATPAVTGPATQAAQPQAAQPQAGKPQPPATAPSAKRESGGVSKSKPRPSPRPAPSPRPSPGPGPGPKIAGQAPASGTGTLRLNSRPWSRVLVDGRAVGNTPQTQLVLSAGWHTITLVNPDFGLQKVITVRIKPGEITTKIVDLQ